MQETNTYLIDPDKARGKTKPFPVYCEMSPSPPVGVTVSTSYNTTHLKLLTTTTHTVYISYEIIVLVCVER